MAGLALTPIGGGRGRTALDDIDQSVRDTVEEAVTYFITEGNTGRLQTEPFSSREDGESWLADARAYAYQRPAGRVVVSGNTARAPGNTAKEGGPVVVRFSVAAYVAPAPADGAATPAA